MPLFEMRTYHAAPGKFDAMLSRFTGYTVPLLQRHNITLTGAWTPRDNTPETPDDTLIYMVQHESQEAAERNWEAFRTDPEWQQVKTRSDAGGPLVESIERCFMNQVV